MRDILQSSSFARLQGILKSHYDRELEMSFLNDTGFSDQSEEGHVLLKDGILHIPIRSHGHFLGIAKIPDAQALSESSHSAIVEIVRLILEPALYNAFLSRAQTNAQHQAHQAGLHIVDATLQPSPVSTVERSPVILVTSHNPARISRVAVQTHETMGRWALVNWHEIKSQVRTSKDLRDLGKMTIFVEDVLHLTGADKTLLENWLNSSAADSQPALILGSSMIWPELRDQELLPTLILHEAGFRQIQADRLPADRRFCEEAIKLLLDKEAALQS